MKSLDHYRPAPKTLLNVDFCWDYKTELLTGDLRLRSHQRGE